MQETPSALVTPLEPHKPLTLRDDRKVHAFSNLVDSEDTLETIPSHDEIPLLQTASSSSKIKSLSSSSDTPTQSSSDSKSLSSKNLIPVTHNPSRAKRVRALGYVVTTAFNFSIMSACVKHACRSLSSHEVALWPTLLAWAFIYVRT